MVAGEGKGAASSAHGPAPYSPPSGGRNGREKLKRLPFSTSLSTETFLRALPPGASPDRGRSAPIRLALIAVIQAVKRSKILGNSLARDAHSMVTHRDANPSSSG